MNGDDKRSLLVLVVDDDPAVRQSTARLLEIAGHRVLAFESGNALLAAGIPEGTDLILMDVMMPGLSGLDTLRALRDRQAQLPPVVIVTGHADVPLAVEAMKLGASELFEKPYPVMKLRQFVNSLAEHAAGREVGSEPEQGARAQVGLLTRRQRDILKGMATGEPSKVIAHRLGLSVRTVETYRRHIFARLSVRGVVDATRIAVAAGLLDD